MHYYTRTVSPLLDTIFFPSGENNANLTAPVWHARVC
eukprot:COSAG02_NODE_22270_length_758_cov_0.725341_2_plen_36_part_01